MLRIKFVIAALISLLLSSVTVAQNEEGIGLTKEKVLSMSSEELSDLPLEDLMAAIEIAGVSSLDELYELLLNKNVTSASKSSENLFDSPLSTTVLSYDEIIRSGATSIEEAMRLVPGIIVREKTNGNYDVHIRGLDNIPSKNLLLYSENTSTLVMINRRPVFNYAMGGTLWETLPIGLGDISCIEVVRGPSGALYGPNAVSGVINIVTKEHTDYNKLLSGNMQAGSLNTYIGDLAFRKKVNEKLYVGLTGNYNHRNRSTEELYVFKEQKFFSKSEYAELKDKNGNSYFDPNDNINVMYAEPSLARENYGANAFIDYRASDTRMVSLSGGYQYSNILSSTMGDNPASASGRESSTAYLDLRGLVHGFDIQANYMFGVQDFYVGNEGFKNDMGQLNATVEYDLNFGSLGVRPGVNYTSVFYNDDAYLSQTGTGFLNGKSQLDIMAASLRLDYYATDNLRFVGAFRTENYSHQPAKWTPSWQLISQYKLNDNNNVRFVYARSNKSPFLVETHSNYIWDRTHLPKPDYMHFTGNKDMSLMTLNMLELGYRTRPTKNILLDLELYYSSGSNYTVLSPDSINMSAPAALAGMMPTLMGSPIVSAYMNYRNIPVESIQTGASLNVDWVINAKLIAKAHVTVQQTKLDNHNPITRDEILGTQAYELYHINEDGTPEGIFVNEMGRMALSGELPAAPDYAVVSATSDWQPDRSLFKNDFKHKSTPDYWGSIGIDYRPTDKISIFSNCYLYGKQVFMNQYDSYTINAKALLNAKVSYKASDKLTMYINGRNILNMKAQEFAFLDEVPGMVLGGVNFSF
ncbi:TonB-dependent siderophore receptor [Carboxylicivirga sp. M1479]|uniref:TonB-dependent receptor plug domain-containing protein n=1 Tax=Carboxylicivirga sp. M1479 TaxID=2594476 RepID=UPI00117851D8|nr:TonB-dependent receptor [Carboxylicivirga sp. M1479]TRX71332.1 hypothetical protein FNN09_06990 [Carboxylicivirga sp. M1479]